MGLMPAIAYIFSSYNSVGLETPTPESESEVTQLCLTLRPRGL